MNQRTLLLTVLALGAFAANSILCRFALQEGAIDPASFTAIRMACGAAILLPWLIQGWSRRATSGGWAAAILLVAYAVAFAWAYLGLSAGTGALLLFGSVQATVSGLSVAGGHRPERLEWVGLVVSFAGLIYLVAPGWQSPPLGSALLMVLAGAAWGGYTILGKSAASPILATAHNFLLGLPIALLAAVPTSGTAHVTAAGAGLAAISGGLTSGLGYVAWYGALKGLSPAQSGLVQLAVPVIAAVAGVVLLSEPASLRLGLASILVLGGIGVALHAKRSKSQSP